MQDGHIIYQGPAKESAYYFEAIGMGFPQYSNPADYFISKLLINYPKQKEDLEKVEFYLNSYNQKLKKTIKEESEKLKIKTEEINGELFMN